MSTEVNLSAYRGDNQTHTFTYTGTAPTEVRFYVRTKIDGDLLLGLKYTEKPTQFTINDMAKTIAVALLPADTSPIEHGDWYYDIDIAQGTTITTLQYGLFQLQGDIATDTAADDAPDLEMHTPASAAANVVWAGPASGAAAIPTFRALVDADIPAAIARDSEITSAISTHAELMASASQAGHLSAANWTTFNNKQNALGYVPVNRAGDTMTGPFVITTLDANTPNALRITDENGLLPFAFGIGNATGYANMGIISYNGTVMAAINTSSQWIFYQEVSVIYNFSCHAPKLNAELNIEVYNQDAHANSDAVLQMNVTGAAGGNPYIRWQLVDGAAYWAMGVDNSDSDKLEISPGFHLDWQLPALSIWPTREITMFCAPAALADAALNVSEIQTWVDEAANLLTFKVKYSTGVVKSGTVALA